MPQGLRRRKRGGPQTPAYLGEERRAGNEGGGGRKKDVKERGRSKGDRQVEKQKEGWGLPDESRSGDKRGKRNLSLGHAREEEMA